MGREGTAACISIKNVALFQSTVYTCGCTLLSLYSLNSNEEGERRPCVVLCTKLDDLGVLHAWLSAMFMRTHPCACLKLSE